MPLWQTFIPEDAYSAEDEKDLGNRITNICSDNFDLPRFYTSVFFHKAKPESYIVGGEPRSQFVQVAIVHTARRHQQVAERLGIEVADRGFEPERTSRPPSAISGTSTACRRRRGPTPRSDGRKATRAHRTSLLSTRTGEGGSACHVLGTHPGGFPKGSNG